VAALWIGILTLVFSWYGYAHLPVRDYRPYAEGNSISAQKEMGVPPVTQAFVQYRNIATGEVKEYDSNGAYPWDDDNYEYVDRRIVEIEPGIESNVQDFLLTDVEGNDMTWGILNEPGPVLLVMIYDMSKTDTDCLPEIRELVKAGTNKGWYVYGVTASPFATAEEFRHEHQMPFEIMQCDEKTIKTAIRSNPGVMLLQEGTVRGLWHCNDAPNIDEAAAKLQ
jgi:peroxiredoxin